MGRTPGPPLEFPHLVARPSGCESDNRTLIKGDSPTLQPLATAGHFPLLPSWLDRPAAPLRPPPSRSIRFTANQPRRVLALAGRPGRGVQSRALRIFQTWPG